MFIEVIDCWSQVPTLNHATPGECVDIVRGAAVYRRCVYLRLQSPDQVSVYRSSSSSCVENEKSTRMTAPAVEPEVATFSRLCSIVRPTPRAVVDTHAIYITPAAIDCWLHDNSHGRRRRFQYETQINIKLYVLCAHA